MMIPDEIYFKIMGLSPKDLYKADFAYLNGYRTAIEDVLQLILEEEDKAIKAMAKREEVI